MMKFMDLAKASAKVAGISQEAARTCVSSFFEGFLAAVRAADRRGLFDKVEAGRIGTAGVVIPAGKFGNLGTLAPKVLGARMGMNPQTGQAVAFGKRLSIGLTLSPKAREALSGK